jgi:hypothetical protein
VLEDEAPLTPLLVERVRGETQLFVKEVKIGAARYVLCRNQAEAERKRNERQAIVAGLAQQLARGDKALIGNSAYRRYLRRTPSATGKPGPAFEIDPGKLAEEARYDGLFVLRTNARITPLQAVLPTAICCKSKTCSAAPRRSSGSTRSIIPQMPPSAAMCSARSSP